jgi:hypothetical protein
MGELMADMRSTLDELSAQSHLDMKAVAKRMKPAIEAAESANEWLLGQNDATLPSATSVEFLMMHGRLAGGWMIARTALAAANLKQASDADHAYLDARITLARYYAERMLPLVESANVIITDSAETTVALDTAQL